MDWLLIIISTFLILPMFVALIIIHVDSYIEEVENRKRMEEFKDYMIRNFNSGKHDA